MSLIWLIVEFMYVYMSMYNLGSEAKPDEIK